MNNKSPYWRKIEEYPDYFVDCWGDVFSTKHNKLRKLKKLVNKVGYYAVDLYKNGKTEKKCVHWLVAECFLGKTNRVVRHLDDNKLNNDVCNLEYGDQADNKYDEVRLWNRKLTHEDITEIKEMRKRGMIYKDIADFFGIDSSFACRICNNKKYKAHERQNRV